MDRKDVTKGFDTIDKYKVMVSKMGAEHAGEPGKDGMFRVLTTTMRVLLPNESLYPFIFCNRSIRKNYTRRKSIGVFTNEIREVLDNAIHECCKCF